MEYFRTLFTAVLTAIRGESKEYMKLIIEIPKEFETDFNKDKFKDCFGRVQVDLKKFREETLCGNYERETIEMFENAFQNAIDC